MPLWRRDRWIGNRSSPSQASIFHISSRQNHYGTHWLPATHVQHGPEPGREAAFRFESKLQRWEAARYFSASLDPGTNRIGKYVKKSPLTKLQAFLYQSLEASSCSPPHGWPFATRAKSEVT